MIHLSGKTRSMNFRQPLEKFSRKSSRFVSSFQSLWILMKLVEKLTQNIQLYPQFRNILKNDAFSWKIIHKMFFGSGENGLWQPRRCFLRNVGSFSRQNQKISRKVFSKETFPQNVLADTKRAVLISLRTIYRPKSQTFCSVVRR